MTFLFLDSIAYREISSFISLKQKRAVIDDYHWNSTEGINQTTSYIC
jgi:hypothetical protein